jgi:hypothetical protein
MEYLFYRRQADDLPNGAEKGLPEGYRCVFWKPTILTVCPRGLPDRNSALTFLFWWLVYGCGLRRNGCRFLLIYSGSEVAHFTGILPKCSKFPFMAAGDVQFGPARTHDEHQRRGLLAFALDHLMRTYSKPDRDFWWLCRENNTPSRAAIEKAGFALAGVGRKEKHLGTGFLSKFTITRAPAPLNG